MAQDKIDVSSQLTKLWERNDIPILETADKRYALMSDIHLGDGGDADDFVENEPALLKALDYYRENGYTLLLLGDIEEFWQFELDTIENRYKETVYSRMKGFGRDRVIRSFGNHDYEWGGFIDPISGAETSQIAYEAVKLADHAGVARIMLFHGHQGTIESDKYSWFSRFWVRLFSFVEPLAKSARLYVIPQPRNGGEQVNMETQQGLHLAALGGSVEQMFQEVKRNGDCIGNEKLLYFQQRFDHLINCRIPPNQVRRLYGPPIVH